MSLEEREDLKALSLAAALQASPEPENAAARKEHAESIGEAPSAWLEVRAALVFCAGREACASKACATCLSTRAAHARHRRSAGSSAMKSCATPCF